ncbi:hypothetical protein LELG_01510 [Lodderomyces elongisporus NRRL YB-4239]|uniref:Uncharacterized protein n=1 Tax=Lodderomyces elongisporus (strain ATCC 11503 / CBS 2605 / JCM 1781 / NBRC 1676 / NRRL YB-4239) TaxID=379508 RepID=A5DVX4_LODEL|nr:hypothetical protein LELG_01510 [Lodderomyces elongisporus NRRL YB-4239]
MLRSMFGPWKHSREFRRLMVTELRPLFPLQSLNSIGSVRPPVLAQIRNFSELSPSFNDNTHHSNQSKFETAKQFWKNAHEDDSKESKLVLKYLRKGGAISILVVFASIGLAVYQANSNQDEGKQDILEEMEIQEYMPKLSEDIRYKKTGV